MALNNLIDFVSSVTLTPIPIRNKLMSAVITTTSQAVELVLLSGNADVLATRYLPSMDVAIDEAIKAGASSITHETLDF